MSTAQRPIPAPSAETRPFWEGAKAGTLTLARCRDCGRIPYPPRPRCPDCLSDRLEWIDLSGKALLKGWTDVHLPALPGREGPICIVECALAEDPRTVIAMLDETGSVRGCAPDTPLTISMRMDANGWGYPQATVDTQATS
ncbi:MAG: zinc ribbon domain-containing protein [Pseudomonadota bacterium]|jgi:uncharacterized OB-fold protein|nr:zinc ribbon domain-containing protein [Pseudomonadota bacterium]